MTTQETVYLRRLVDELQKQLKEAQDMIRMLLRQLSAARDERDE